MRSGGNSGNDRYPAPSDKSGLNEGCTRRMRAPIPVSFCVMMALFAGCDPVIPIKLMNEMGDTLTVRAHRTINFHTSDVHTIELNGDYRNSWIEFKVAPNSTVGCGSAIAGIEDEMPFTDLVLIKASGDSIVAHGEKEVLNLFDHGAFNGLETPLPDPDQVNRMTPRSTKSCLNEGCLVRREEHLTGVCCRMRVDEETVAR